MEGFDSPKKRIIVLIPAYEPGESFIPLLQEIRERSSMSIVVVNDGTERESARIEEAVHYAKVVHHSQNRGKGAALKTGLRYIQEHYSDDVDTAVLTMDADGQHKFSDAVRLVHQLRMDEMMMVLGVRQFDKAVPFRSRFGNSVTKGVFHLVTGRVVNDTQTGMRLFPISMISGLLEIEGDHFEYEMNVLLELTRNNIRIAEVPIRTIYENDNKGSHFHALKDSLRIYIGIFKFMAASFFCFLLDLFCFSVLNYVTAGIHLTTCNVVARLISASVNFTINKNLVFKDEQSVIKTALKYIVVAVIVLTCNTLLLNLLVKVIGANAIFSKILVECIMFFFSWATQQFLIFNRTLTEGRAAR